ncbi:MAG TPA: ABC transporter permease [Kouleothrix sp.]|uniref:ABC transporter permease n=1 Tax=Kouleothrix sp. TaxID=2779161 RepID=UPI002C6038BC|nr:ABC transporter permease [Kouleothrix sp.]HRC75630.1 ABC transporter permease [Kouleothrix sp.]
MQGALSRRTIGSELRAIAMIGRKEWTIFRRYPSWIISMFVWPVLLPFGYIFSARALGGPGGEALATFERLAGTSDYVAFIVVGTVLWMWLNMTLWDVGLYLRSEQMHGTLESNWLCPTWRVSLMLGGALAKLLVSVVFLGVSLLEFRLAFDVHVLGGNLGLALLALLLTIPTIHGIGVAFASLVLRFKEANAMVFLVRGLFMIFCGITFPLAVLPGWMQSVAAALPLTYSIRALRGAMLTGATFEQLRGDLLALALFAIASPLAGYALFAVVERGARRRGDLGQY